MSVEATSNITMNVSMTNTTAMPNVNVNAQKAKALAKTENGINTDSGVKKMMSAIPSLGLSHDATKQTTESRESATDQKYSEVMTEKAVENANNRVRATRTNAKFEYNEDINRIIITITDENKEVIREIPPEETQKMLERIHTFSGMMVDTEI